MSVTTTHAFRDSHVDTNNGLQAMAGFMSDAPDQGISVAVEQFVAYVLRRAHETAESDNNPDGARAILHVANSFASELETTNPDFNRFRFIEAATGL